LAFAQDATANLIRDKAYDSDPLDIALQERGVEMIARRTSAIERGRMTVGVFGRRSEDGLSSGSSHGYKEDIGLWSVRRQANSS